MDILPVNNLTKIVEPTRHENRDQQQKRQPQRRGERIKNEPVYTPDGHVDEEPVSKIDVVA